MTVDPANLRGVAERLSVAFDSSNPRLRVYEAVADLAGLDELLDELERLRAAPNEICDACPCGICRRARQARDGEPIQ